MALCRSRHSLRRPETVARRRSQSVSSATWHYGRLPDCPRLSGQEVQSLAAGGEQCAPHWRTADASRVLDGRVTLGAQWAAAGRRRDGRSRFAWARQVWTGVRSPPAEVETPADARVGDPGQHPQASESAKTDGTTRRPLSGPPQGNGLPPGSTWSEAWLTASRAAEPNASSDARSTDGNPRTLDVRVGITRQLALLPARRRRAVRPPSNHTPGSARTRRANRSSTVTVSQRPSNVAFHAPVDRGQIVDARRS